MGIDVVLASNMHSARYYYDPPMASYLHRCVTKYSEPSDETLENLVTVLLTIHHEHPPESIAWLIHDD